MKRLLTVMQAKAEIQSLQSFIQLAEGYDPTTLQQEVLKTYAFTGSITKTVTALNEERKRDRLPLIDAGMVTEMIKRKPGDPLHRIIRSAYMNKTRHTRKK